MSENIFIAGDDATITITAKDESGAVIPLGSSDIDWKMINIKDSTDFLTKSIASGVSITDAPNGIFVVTLPNSDTEGRSGEYNQEAKITDGSGNFSRLRKKDVSPSSIYFEPKIVD